MSVFKKGVVTKTDTQKIDEFIQGGRGDTVEEVESTKIVTKEKKKVGRKKTTGEKRDRTFLMYFTDSEFEKIELAAKKVGLNPNQYIRHTILSHLE
ncbi:plasmid mobilization protein [Campylobacter sp. MOP51]|uniref:plasmid mobilization protein n=1 Tax=Campylobacter canis TaxID=3378588 RepID=UPI003C43DF09